ncbi:glutamate-5-semialdehyde dehydrogenase [bacterium]|nr:glutamate-5-semialdehyde dehydrogenase [bacterium]
MSDIRWLATEARAASRALADADTGAKNAALFAMAAALRERTPEIVAANDEDRRRALEGGLSDALMDRLSLSPERLDAIARGVEEVAALPDPVGEISSLSRRPNGMLVGRMRIPLGVIGLIYEARPGVAADAASLCLKAGNAIVLRGGSDAASSNKVIGEVLQGAIAAAGLPGAAVTVIDDPSREVMKEFLALDDLVDLVIPRGGEGLIRFVAENSRIPVLKHYKGVCHLYIDRTANPEMAVALALNGKTQRPGVCNAVETILVHEEYAKDLLASLCRTLAAAGVEIRGCERTLTLFPEAAPASEDDWGAEYLDLIVAMRVVRDMHEAIEHIRAHGSDHTETIVTDHHPSAMEFLRRVGSSTVLVNASTRFADGFQLGLGAEIGISTSRLHAFGPMGLEGLTTRKFVVFGDGQIRTS